MTTDVHDIRIWRNDTGWFTAKGMRVFRNRRTAAKRRTETTIVVPATNEFRKVVGYLLDDTARRVYIDKSRKEYPYGG